ncbi:putative disease resistance RPP13-like protein 1 [Rosa sericea]
MALFRGHHKASPSRYTTSPSGFAYDVFLSFRGEDTRKNFTDHLHTALLNARFRTFRDDPELKRGENIKEELEKAIRESRSSVIVFSKDYASSKWCLDELVIILERKRTFNHFVLPVFYHVDPSHLRNQTASVAKAFTEHQKTQSSEKLNGWRAALKEVADLAGMNLQDGHESKFIQNIVREIQDKLGRVPLTDVQEVLQKKLSFINPVLNDAEGKQLNNPTVKAWLNELKEAVYDAEDLLQEIKTEALRQKIEREYGSSTSKEQEHSSTPPSHAFDSALIYPKVEEVLERLDFIMEQRRDVWDMEASAGYRVSQTIPSTSLVEDSVYGRDEEKEGFIKLLLSDDETGNKIGVLPIVGMGGIGKTTLAQFLYNDVRVKQHFHIQAWVCVSKEFDILRISQHIYESLTLKACKIKNLDLLQSKLQDTLLGKRFFFVLDDIWNKNYSQLEFLRRLFQSGAHGSKIIVTTRDEDVARKMSRLEAHHLMPMSEQDSSSLFEKHAFKNADVGARARLEEIGRQIVQKCNGLPLAIKSLGGLLCSKLSPEEWESILDSDIWELTQEESDDILPSLWLSYLDLPLHLKRCFSYCSIFPKNYRLQKSELLLLWNAQGFLQPLKKKMVEQVGEEYFNDLISRSFFQRSSSSEHFIMHDLIKDLANFVSGEFSVRWENSESPNILRETRHFSYMEKHGDSFAKLEAIHEAKYLRTLLPVPQYASYLGTFYRDKFQKVLHEVLPKLQCLRMLNLSLYDIKKLPDSIDNLKHLRHLDMSETPIRKLPNSICTLYNLQALLLRGCRNLVELPTKLGRLISLRHLDIKDTGIEKMPPHMGNLKDLQILTEFVLDKYTEGHNALELKKLQNLRGTLCISGLENVVDGSALVANIVRDKEFVTELNLNWKYTSEKGDMVEEREVLEKLQPHLKLKRLTIKGYGGKMFPGWSEYYSSESCHLVYLELVDCANCTSLPPLGQLPYLRELHISGLGKVVSISSEFYYGDGNTSTSVKKPFRCLRFLKFHNMRRWQEWCYVVTKRRNKEGCCVGGDDNEGGVFPNLVELVLSSCDYLTGILAFDSFPMLKEVVLSGMDLSLDSRLLSVNKLRLQYSFTTFLDGVLHAPNLTSLEINTCWNFTAWPKQMHSLLPSLVSLSVQCCRGLECFPEGGFPSKLKSLVIMGCTVDKKSGQNLNKGLRRLTSLEKLTLDFARAEDWFAAEGPLPSTLTHLEIWNLNGETIDGAKWFGHLNSLQQLVICDCSALRCLPDSELPTSLQRLQIVRCPLLKERYGRVSGEHWRKIAHIPFIMIDGLRKSD